MRQALDRKQFVNRHLWLLVSLAISLILLPGLAWLGVPALLRAAIVVVVFIAAFSFLNPNRSRPTEEEQPAIPEQVRSSSAEGVEYFEPDASWVQRRKSRSVAIAVALAVLVALFYAATLVHLGGNVFNRPL